MPFGPYTNDDDCVSKNPDKDDPDAYCATIKRQAEGEGLRHPDFKKINRQFLMHIKDECAAITRYYNWIDNMNLDETRCYRDSLQEQFKWTKRHVDFTEWKHDKRATYWRFEAGFPVESMNENIYTEDELLRSARTLVGKPVNLNHKFPLPTIEIVGAEYENGVVEGVMRVPNNLMCPICDTSKTINTLIKDKGIINNSLEAGCAYVGPETQVCEGMFFSGMALLSNQTLPGIPLTRYLPLETIMVEALQVSTVRRKRKVKRIEMKVMEEDEPIANLQAQIVTLEKEIQTLNDAVYGAEADPEMKARLDILYAKKQKLLDTVGLSTESKKEQADECPEGEHKVDGKCVPVTAEQAQDIQDCPEGEIWDPRANDSHGGCVPTGEVSAEQVVTVDTTDPTGPGMRDIAPKAVFPDTEGRCPSGYILNLELGQCIIDEECPEKQHFDQKLQQCVADTVPVPEHPETSLGTAAAPAEMTVPDRKVITHDPTGGEDPHERPFPQVDVEPGKKQDVKVPPSVEPIPDKPLTSDPQPPFTTSTEVGKEVGTEKDAHDCPDGMHYDFDETQCVQNTPILENLPTLEERIGRRKAERSVKALKHQLTESDVDYGRLYKAYQQARGKLEAYKQGNAKLEHKLDKYNVSKVTDEVKIRDKTRRIEDLTIARDDYKHQLEKLRTLYEQNDRKYQETLSTNLALSRKLTKSSEDYLAVASRVELLEAKLKQTRNLAKKTLKIKL